MVEKMNKKQADIINYNLNEIKGLIVKGEGSNINYLSMIKILQVVDVRFDIMIKDLKNKEDKE